MKSHIIGVDLGGTNVKTALVTRDGAIVCKDSRPTHADGGPDAVIGDMCAGVDAVLAETGKSKDDVLALGVGAPGPMNWQTGVVYSPPNLPGWKDVPLAKLMHERTGLPAYVDNDANVACWGEFWKGSGHDVESLVMLTLGTGVGGGIVVAGQLLRGPDGTAGELGHLCVNRNGRQCNCGAKGCLETYASVSGLVRTAIKHMDPGRVTVLTDMSSGDPDKITGKMVSDAVDQGDTYAAWVMKETATWLGIGIASLINALNPEVIVLGGGMIAAGDALFVPVRETVRAQAFEVPAKRAEVIPASLGNDAGVIGAAGCALQRYEMEHG